MKKFVSLLPAFVLLLSLCACAKPTEQTETAQTAEGLSYHGELPLVQPGEDNVITIGINTSSNVLDYDDNAYTKWVEEQTGVDLQFIQFAGSSSDAGTQVALMMAGGEELPDILFGFGGVGKTKSEEYGRDGYFVDLAPYFGTCNHYQIESFKTIFGDEWEEVHNTLMSRAVNPETGGIYTYPAIQQVPLDSPKYHTWINQDWLDTLGLTAPTNIEELYDVLVAFRDGDPNGNGLKDEIPMIGKAGDGYADVLMYIINAFIPVNASYHFNVKDGVLSEPYTTEEYRQAMIFLKKLVDEGLLSTMTWTQTSGELEALINGTTGEYTCGIIAGHADVGFQTGNDSIYMYNPLKPLADATGKGGYAPRKAYSYVYTTNITADCDNVFLAFKLLDFMQSQESFLRQRFGEFGVDWVWADEGTKGHMGGEAKIKLLRPNLWNEQSNACWYNVNSVASESYYEQQLLSDGTGWADVKNAKLLENYNNVVAAGEPEELFTVVAYTEEENEIRSSYRVDCQKHIETTRANFATGVMDPAKDADWRTYVDGLEAMGLYEWMAAEQSAYTRSLSF